MDKNRVRQHLKHRVESYLQSKTDQCLPFVNNRGRILASQEYGSLQFVIDGTKGRLAAHRLVFELYNNENLTVNDVVMHVCDNPHCCNPRHLKKGTHKDNCLDKVKKGRQAKGVSNGRYKTGYHSKYDPVKDPLRKVPNPDGGAFKKGHMPTCAKLPIEVAKNAKKELAGWGGTVAELAKKLNVPKQILFDIRRGKAYRNL